MMNHNICEWYFFRFWHKYWFSFICLIILNVIADKIVQRVQMDHCRCRYWRCRRRHRRRRQIKPICGEDCFLFLLLLRCGTFPPNMASVKSIKYTERKRQKSKRKTWTDNAFIWNILPVAECVCVCVLFWHSGNSCNYAILDVFGNSIRINKWNFHHL